MGKGPIVVYGATGYTGRLVAAELKRIGARFALAGRNRERLERLAGQLELEEPVRTASVNDVAALEALLADASSVIACAGPFTLVGEPVVAAAIKTRTHYIDTTGEQEFVRTIFERYDKAAGDAGVAVVPAMGFDIVPADMGASLAAAGLGQLDELVIAYSLRGIAASRGTMRSTLHVIGGSGAVYRDGTLSPAPAMPRARTVRFAPPLGEQQCIPFPASESVTVPRHVDAANVEVLMSTRTIAPLPLLSRGMPWLTPAASFALRTPLRSLLARAIDRLPEGPSEARRQATVFQIVIEARGATGARRVVVSGRDMYASTAASCAHAAQLQARTDYRRRGVLAPSQAFRPRPFLDYLSDYGLKLEASAC